MLRVLSIENFRGIRELGLDGLGRVNLLVGRNNSGKTSVLEAVHILQHGGDVGAVVASLRRRAERPPPDDDVSSRWSLDVRHLFHERSLDTQIRLVGETDEGHTLDVQLSAPLIDPSDEEQSREWRE
ncbi:MAG TPA: AAA family ATPase [Myxococcota bacterium]|nr:AAA family ATPase [Myxococcota bacterium]